MLGFFFPNMVAGLLEAQTVLARLVADSINALIPATYGGSVLKWVVAFHDALIAGVEALAWMPKRLLPQAVTDLFPNGFGSGAVAAAKIVFGLVLVYIEYRFFRLIYLAVKGCMWCIEKIRAPFRPASKVVNFRRAS